MKCDNCTKAECSKNKGRNTEKSENAEMVHEDQEDHIRSLLSACLSCDGCISAAECNLIAQQSPLTLQRVIDLNRRCDSSKHRLIVVSISPQSRAAIAARYGLSLLDTMCHLTSFLRGLGVSRIFDLTFAEDFALLECQREFVQRFQEGSLPLLTSSCSGWVVFAEKTHGKIITPHLSTCRSSQQIMGSLLKDYFAKQQAVKPESIYHVVVMPCYDKKLEATRMDFYRDNVGIRDVDCVLTTGELVKMLENNGLTSLADIEKATPDTLFSCMDVVGMRGHSGNGTGGYLEHVFRYAAKELFGQSVTDIKYKTLRNKDFREVVLERDGKVQLRFAAAYGFRNVQNVVQKLKRDKFPYHFVEVAACSAGCLSGRGQVVAGTDQELADLPLEAVEAAYRSTKEREPCNNATMLDLYSTWLGGEGSEDCRRQLHTQFHPNEKAENGLW
uniref:cytosolic Fe-S cluster assembly factor narfl-like isoform X1 n=2 Tax=Myxine glutinosa TaxID=7769 RepID=UPI00358FF550